MKIKEFIRNNQSILSFLTLETLALVSFSLGFLSEIFFFVGSLIAILTFFSIFICNYNEQKYYDLIPITVVLFIISGFVAFGPFSKVFSLISNVASFFAIPSFFVLGYSVRRLCDLKIKHIMFAIGIGLATIVLLGMVSTWIDYGFFYSLIYRLNGKVNYYYNGIPYNITKEMYWLIDMKFSEISIQYGGLFATLCAIYLPASLFIDRTNNKKDFYITLAIGVVGLLSLLTIPNFMGLVVFVLVTVGVLLIKKIKNEKVYNGLAIGFGIFLAIGILYWIITIVLAAKNANLSGFLGRVFQTNGLIKNSTDVLKGIFGKADGKLPNIFGLDISNPSYDMIFGLSNLARLNTGIFEYQILKEAGVFASLLFIGFISAMLYFMFNYLKKSDDEVPTKLMIVAFVLAFLIYSTIGNEVIPQTHSADRYYCFLRSGLTMTLIFIFGLIYRIPSKNKEKK